VQRLFFLSALFCGTIILLIGYSGLCEPRETPLQPEEAAYFPITGPCRLEFPRDHAAHPGYRTEWWYYTGNLRSEAGARYGFQLTFFRTQISPPGAEATWPQPASPWRTQQLYLAHAALSDIEGKQFFHAEQLARGALDMAGVHQDDTLTEIWLRNWSARLEPDAHRLAADGDDFALELTLRPKKPAVLHGTSGYSRKGSTLERASCYYSFTRLEAAGTLTVQGKPVPVRGQSWMDHEFSSAPLEPDLAGWDWFSLQFANHTELMIYLLRQKDGGVSPASSGTFVDVSGKATHLPADAFQVEVLDHWQSSHSKAHYPSGWRLKVGIVDLDLTVVPQLADQEMRTPETTGVTYWEGSVSVSGASRGEPLTGVGYVELTGYEKPFDAPL
jgi:predicted secreted hydrolase